MTTVTDSNGNTYVGLSEGCWVARAFCGTSPTICVDGVDKKVSVLIKIVQPSGQTHAYSVPCLGAVVHVPVILALGDVIIVFVMPE